MYQSEDKTNLPENVSEAAKKLYTILSNSDGAKSSTDLKAEYASWAPGTERYKAIATANSLVVKGVLIIEKDNETEEFYKLVKGSNDVGPSEEADSNEEYAKKTDTNEEEKRMINILEQHGKRLSSDELFNKYLQEQTPDSTAPTPEEDIQAALKELTDAGIVTTENDAYQLKK